MKIRLMKIRKTAPLFFCCVTILLVSLVAVAPLSGQAAGTVSVPGLYNPVADPKAVVVRDHARFTILTPQLVRMEWAADGKFEDHASFVFLNRHLPVPKVQSSEAGGALTIKTDALELRYHPAAGDAG